MRTGAEMSFYYQCKQTKTQGYGRTHMAPAMTAFPFPMDLFMRFIENHDGELTANHSS